MPGGRLRTRAPAGVLAGLVLVPVAIWGWTSQSDSGAELLVERAASGPPETAALIVSLPDEELNDADTTGGNPTVVIACLGADDEVEFRVAEQFPFTDTDGGTAPPHVHQLVPATQLDTIERCRLEGVTPELEGELVTAGG